VPCDKCNYLTAECQAALDRFRQATEEFERLSPPTRTDLNRLDRTRLEFDQARAALDEHLKEHLKEHVLPD